MKKRSRREFQRREKYGEKDLKTPSGVRRADLDDLLLSSTTRSRTVEPVFALEITAR